MDLVAITDNMAAVAATIPGIRGAVGQEIDTIPATPYVVIGLPRALQVLPGDRTVTNMAIPINLYVEQLSDTKRDLRTAFPYVPTFVTTYALDQSLAGTVQDCTITAWDTNRVGTIGGADYWVIVFTATVTVHEHVTQALRTAI